MASNNTINLRSFPKIKVLSSALFIVGAILAHVLSSKPELMLFQIGGIPLNLVFGIFPLLSGVILLIYALITYYSVIISCLGDKISFKSRITEIILKKEEIQAVRVRDADKNYIWFVFLFINFFFVYYGIECSLYFAANHHAGLLEFVLIPMFLIWFAGLMLILFPRKLIAIYTNDKIILQKVNHLPKNNAFEKLFDKIFGFDMSEKKVEHVRSDRFQYRLILGVIFLIIFVVTNLLVEIDDIFQPLHLLGIFIPQFLLIFSVLMVSSSLSAGISQSIEIKKKRLRIEEITLITPISGKNFIWIKSMEDTDKNDMYRKGFRTLTVFDILLTFVMFGQGFLLAFKFIWLPDVYLTYLDGWDIFLGVVILIVLTIYQFEIVTKLNNEFNSEYGFKREIIVHAPDEKQLKAPTKGIINNLKTNINIYLKDFKGLLRSDFKNQFIKISLASLAGLVIITITYSFLGFVFFVFI